MKALKIVLYLVLGLVVLVAAAAAIFAMTFDPNRYKGDIQRIVKEKTGRTLELKGKPVAKVQPIITVTPDEAARILREISESDKGDDWAEYVSW